MNIKDLISKYESISLTLPALPVGYIQIIHYGDVLNNNSNEHSQLNSMLPFSRSKCYSVPIKSSSLLTKSLDDVKQVYEILFDLKGIEGFEFNPGDTIGILPINSNEEVSTMLSAISPSSELYDQKISIQLIAGSRKKLPNYLPHETSIRKCVRECLDLHSIPKKLFLRSLIDYLMDDEEKRFLAILCSKEGAADYSERILQSGIVFLDILKNLKSWNEIPFPLLLEHLPRLLPRPYSIANSPYDRNNLKIWFSLHEPPGITTKMLCDVISNASPLVPIYLRQSNAFTYTRNEMNDPVILIAAGVGVSPFLGFLDHREAVKNLESGVRLANATVFYGCRYERDNLCDEIFKRHLKTGSLNDLKMAFSRDSNSEYKYVQDQITSNGNLFVETLIKSNGRVYVCGSVNMVQDVKKTIRECLADSLVDSNASNEYIQNLIKDKRYIEDTWI